MNLWNKSQPDFLNLDIKKQLFEDIGKTLGVKYKTITQVPDPEYYIRVTENVKARWQQHRQSFRNIEMQHAFALSTTKHHNIFF